MEKERGGGEGKKRGGNTDKRKTSRRDSSLQYAWFVNYLNEINKLCSLSGHPTCTCFCQCVLCLFCNYILLISV